MPAIKTQNHLCQLTFTDIATLFCVVLKGVGGGEEGRERGVEGKDMLQVKFDFR